MLRQVINGRRVGTVVVNASGSDLMALAGLFAGKVEVYDEMFSGGTSVNGIALNPYSFSVGKQNVDGSRYSCTIRLPHLKPSKSIGDIRALVLGEFEADFDAYVKCEYVNGVYNKS